MAYMVIFELLFFMTFTQAENPCTAVDLRVPIIHGKMLPGSQLTTLTSSGRISCAQSCLSRRRCKSVNFQVKTGECHLNSRTIGSSSTKLIFEPNFVAFDVTNWPEIIGGACVHHTCPLNSYCEPTNDDQFVCRVTGCLASPAVNDSHFNNVPEKSPFGAVLSYTCDPGYLAQGLVICQNNGTWSSPMCVSVSSCSMVKQYQSDSQDGEYWLRLSNFDTYTTKIYCHNMSSSSPIEFLTLPYVNIGIYPNIMDQNCDGSSHELLLGCTGDGGEIWHNKIRLEIDTMKVTRSDRTFANISGNGRGLMYGNAFDCYTPHENNALRCGTKGKFTIDLRGTGWRVREEQDWQVIYGHRPMIESVDRQINGTLITLRCGGFPGGCQPIGGLLLSPFP